MKSLRILFASLHGYIDPSNGASTATRDLLELLTSRGHDCRAFTATLFDFAREVSAESLLHEASVSFRKATATLA